MKPLGVPRKRVLSPWVAFSTACVIAACYYCFLTLHLLPQLRRLNYLQYTPQPLPATLPDDPHMHPAERTEVMTVLIGFHVAFFLFLAAYFQAMFTSPGLVPANDARWERGYFGPALQDHDDREVERIVRDRTTNLDDPRVRAFLQRQPLVERKRAKLVVSAFHNMPNDVESKEASPPLTGGGSDELKRKCHTCSVYKPDRTHHCSKCGTCILRMDHHCPWLSNCIGAGNYKYFILILFYGLISLGFLLVSLIHRVLNAFQMPPVSTKYLWRHDVPLGTVFGLGAIVFIILFCFTCFHVYLMCNALTTIEYREKKNHTDPDVVHRFRVAHVKYDRGSAYANVKHILGSPYMWLFPVKPDNGEDGTYWHTQQHQ